jgi:hypothetical protein
MGLEKTVERERKIYGNWKVFSPEGYLMFRCNEKKAKWYLTRELATCINNDSIKLNFVPKGLGNHNKDYGLNVMINHCVNCGSDEFLTRHHVVPYCYRRYFPIEIKSHNSHDILSMCAECHENYEYFAFEFKKSLSIEYNSPINGELKYDKNLIKIKKIVFCLINSDIISNIPKKRLREMKSEVKNHFGWKRLTMNRMNSIVNMNLISLDKTHGEILVSKLEDISSFIKNWRSHFLQYNECKYLPENWSVDYE